MGNLETRFMPGSSAVSIGRDYMGSNDDIYYRTLGVRKMNDKLNYAMIGIFLFLVLDSIFKRIINNQYLIALILYLIVPTLIYFAFICHKILTMISTKSKVTKLPNLFKFYIAWIPFLFSDKITKWVRR